MGLVTHCTKNWRYPLTVNDGQSWCASSSLSLMVGISIQNEAMDVARSAPQGNYCHADVIRLLPYLGMKNGTNS